VWPTMSQEGVATNRERVRCARSLNVHVASAGRGEQVLHQRENGHGLVEAARHEVSGRSTVTGPRASRRPSPGVALLFAPSMTIEIVRTPVLRSAIQRVAAAGFGDMVKAVVDVRRRIMAIGGELHSDEEASLLDDGSRQEDLWGINLYPAEGGDEWIEYDSMINVRPSRGNRSRGVDNAELRHTLRTIVEELVKEPSGR